MREAIRRVRELVRRKGPGFSSSPSILGTRRAATADGGGGAGEEMWDWLEGSIWALSFRVGRTREFLIQPSVRQAIPYLPLIAAKC